MENIKKSLENWLNDLNNFSFRNYEDLPELELYMDQVMKYLDKQLYIFQTSTSDKQITTSMINNYVKGEVVPATIAKKYSKEHLAVIQEVCTLKQVLSIAEVKQVLDKTHKPGQENPESYNEFNLLNSTSTSNVVEETFKRLNDVDDNDIEALNKIALDYAIIANSYIEIAKRILYLNRNYEFYQKAKEEYANAEKERLEKEKKKEKKKEESDKKDESETESE